MTDKQHAQAVLARLPDDATWQDIRYSVYVAASIAAGEADYAAGRFKTNEQVMAGMHEWLRSLGPTTPQTPSNPTPVGSPATT